ncbi:MAG: hypothetical protein RR839_00440, partial [Oscillospiraceae bacterium]
IHQKKIEVLLDFFQKIGSRNKFDEIKSKAKKIHQIKIEVLLDFFQKIGSRGKFEENKGR